MQAPLLLTYCCHYDDDYHDHYHHQHHDYHDHYYHRNLSTRNTTTTVQPRTTVTITFPMA